MISLVVGFAAASFIERPDAIVQPEESDDASRMSFDRTVPLEERIRSLEQAVSDERMARQVLQDEVLNLTLELERMSPDVGLVEIAATGRNNRC